MAVRELPEDLTAGTDRTVGPLSSGLYVRILGDGIIATRSLPSAGTVVFGRAPQSDIPVDDPSISRRHARLHIGTGLQIEDLGSTNGTRVGGRTLVRGDLTEISLGEIIEMGSVMAIVQPTSTGGRLRRLWSHGYFEGRLEDECARADRSGAAFAVVRLHVEGARELAEIQEALSTTLRPMDVMAVYAPGEYEVLLVDVGPDLASDMKKELGARMAGSGARIRTGLACYPRDGRTPEELVEGACAAVRRVDGGSGRPRNIVVEDSAVQRLYRVIERVATGTISVLLLGETGVGKEVVAGELHRLSPRGTKPFLKLNCAALSESLLESELFGHERGAFTGAVQAKPGLLETAEGGTVFLDEIGELPMTTQVKLLRVLEERRVLRVGSVKSQLIDVRFISATNRDLDEEVTRGRFRQDLFYRLNGIALVIPPLRERGGEIETFAREFLAQAAEQMGIAPAPALAQDALDLLKRYTWPGNVRELRNVMERAVLLSGSDTIALEHLPLEKMTTATFTSRRIGGETQPSVGHPGSVDDEPSQHPRDLRDDLGALERLRIVDALMTCNGNQTRAAKLLGISRGTLVARMEAYGLPRPRKGSNAES